MGRSIVTADVLENRLILFDNTLNQILEFPSADLSKFQQISNMLSTNVSARYAFAIFRLILIERKREKILNLLNLLEFLAVTGTNELRKYYGDEDFLDELHNLTQSMPADVVQAIVKFVHFSKHSLVNFGGEMNHLEDFYRILKVEGHRFPDINPRDIFIVPAEDLSIEPTWIDGDFCENCHVKFTTFNRKHHCRKCGNIFCNKCSSNRNYVIIQNDLKICRVCDYCDRKLKMSSISSVVQRDFTPWGNDTSISYPTNSVQPVIPSTYNDVSRQEEDDFAKALELSLKEYNEKEAAKAQKSLGSYLNVREDIFANQKVYEEPKFEYPVFEPTPQAFKDDQYVDDSFIKSCEETVTMTEQRLYDAKRNGQVLYKDLSLQAYIQALIAKQGQLQSLIHSNSAEQAKVTEILAKIDHVGNARQSLDEVRRQYKLNMKRQQDDTELLLRLQTEQKMEFMKKQRQENEEQLHKLEEHHRRNIQNQMGGAVNMQSGHEYSENQNRVRSYSSIVKNDGSDLSYNQRPIYQGSYDTNIPVISSQSYGLSTIKNQNMHVSDANFAPNMSSAYEPQRVVQAPTNYGVVHAEYEATGRHFNQQQPANYGAVHAEYESSGRHVNQQQPANYGAVHAEYESSGSHVNQKQPANYGAVHAEYESCGRHVNQQQPANYGAVHAEYESSGRHVNQQQPSNYGAVRAEYESSGRHVNQQQPSNYGAVRAEYEGTGGHIQQQPSNYGAVHAEYEGTGGHIQQQQPSGYADSTSFQPPASYGAVRAIYEGTPSKVSQPSPISYQNYGNSAGYANQGEYFAQHYEYYDGYPAGTNPYGYGSTANVQQNADYYMHQYPNPSLESVHQQAAGPNNDPRMHYGANPSSQVRGSKPDKRNESDTKLIDFE